MSSAALRGQYCITTEPSREVNTMMIIEEESGVITVRAHHPHDGYYAGDFGSRSDLPPAAWETPIPAFDPAA